MKKYESNRMDKIWIETNLAFVFASKTTPNTVVNSGKEVVLNLTEMESSFKMNGVVIGA